MIGKNSMKALSVSAALLLATAGTTAGFQLRAAPQQQQQQRRHQQHQSFAVTAAKDVVRTLVGGAQHPHMQSTTKTMLSAASTASEDADEDRVLDTVAIAKYAGAIVAQMTLFTGLFTGLDALVGAMGIRVPFAVNFFFFFVLALKSRMFNPMSNERPKKDTKEIESAVQRKMPEWTPPGVVFPIVWILCIGPLRAASSALLVSGAAGTASAAYASPAILALMLHLSIGDTWNTINNVERRYGTSVVGVACVWASAAFAAFQYGQVDALAGKLLSLPLIWLTIASSLIVRTWQINPSTSTGKKESLLPTKPASQDGSITKLVWFEGKNTNKME
jgi:benzodiazapine receptor